METLANARADRNRVMAYVTPSVYFEGEGDDDGREYDAAD